MSLREYQTKYNNLGTIGKIEEQMAFRKQEQQIEARIKLQAEGKMPQNEVEDHYAYSHRFCN